jgi:hypothetical protein
MRPCQRRAHTVASARTASGAARLLKRQLDVGLSKYEPDPLAALERVEAEKHRIA